LPVVPPVEVPAARFPERSSAATPTVPNLRLESSAVVEPASADAAGAPLRPRRNGQVLPAQLALQPLPAALGEEEGGGDELQALGGGELLGARADHHHVGRALHDPAGQDDGVAHPGHAGHGARLEGGAVHDRGVQLVAAFRGEDGAPPRVEQRVVLHPDDHRLDRLER
jgi:hypothetical protein